MFIKLNVSYKHKNNKLVISLKKRNRLFSFFSFEKKGQLIICIKATLTDKTHYSTRCYLNGVKLNENF